MANLVLNQSLTSQQYAALKYADLDNAVRWLADYALDEVNDAINFIFRRGMPGLLPDGEWGFTLSGDAGLTIKPLAEPHENRTSQRMGNVPTYTHKLKSLFEIRSSITIYEDKYKKTLLNFERYRAINLAATARAIPNFFKWMSMEVLGGKTAKASFLPIASKWAKTYVVPTDGTTNGYKFMLSEGYGEINLSKVINKQKVTENPFQKELKKINDALYNDSRKVEVTKETYKLYTRDKIKKDHTEEWQKTYAVYTKVADEILKIEQQGYFESKYKHDTTAFEGYDVPTKTSQIIVILNKTEWIKFNREREQFVIAGDNSFSTNFFRGARVLFSDMIDTNTALVLHEDLLQFWIIPSLAKSHVVRYPEEYTVDFITDLGFTYDVVPFMCSLWVTYKG